MQGLCGKIVKEKVEDWSMSKRKTKHSKKTVRKQAGKKITVSEKGMKEDILVHKIAEVPTEMPTKALANIHAETTA